MSAAIFVGISEIMTWIRSGEIGKSRKTGELGDFGATARPNRTLLRSVPRVLCCA